MKIVIVGSGKVGRSITKSLAQENHDITIIDINKQAVDSTSNQYDIQGIYGNGAISSVQLEAKVNKADMFIAVTNKDELNMICCCTAKALGAKCAIARIRDTDYIDEYDFIKENLNIEFVVNPELAAAEEIYNILRFPFAIQVFPFAKGKVMSVEIKIPSESLICGKNIKSLMGESKSKVLISSIIRKDRAIIPNGEFEINADDRINIVGTPAKIDAFFKEVKIYNKRVKSVLIIGGSRISFYLTRFLTGDNIKVKIIERDEKRCKELLSNLEKVEVINADGVLKQVLDEENISGYDACIGLTGLDEQNIITSLYAKSKQVDTVISKVNNETFTEILDDIKLDTVVSPKQVIADQIVMYSRSLRVRSEHSLVRLYKIMEGKVELLEFNIGDNEKIVNKAIKDVKLKNEVLICSIIRGNQVIYPSGDEILLANDCIVVSAVDNVLQKVEDILK